MGKETTIRRRPTLFTYFLASLLLMFAHHYAVADAPSMGQDPVVGLHTLGEEVADVALSDIRGKGSTGTPVRFIEVHNLGVILWDEPGSNRHRNNDYLGAVGHGAIQRNTMTFQNR